MTNFTTSTPHDALFKSFLTHPDTARDFMEIHLPKDLRELCDLDSLKLESASFVDEKLRALHSDILWSVKTREGDGYIYVVIEHQSREDIHMAFRLICYSMAVMQRHIEHDKRRPLPLVIPMLFYHGSRSPYPWSLCWLDEFADPTTARKLYTAAFPLVDVTVVPDDEIVQHRRVALLELIQKHIRQRDLMGLIDQLVILLVTECANDSQITALLNYILLTGDEARFNEFITSKLLSGAVDALTRHDVKEDDIEVAWVPGAFEIPLIASKMAKSNKYDAIICLGAVIRGNTSHYDYVCSEVSKGIAHVSLNSDIPVMFGVVTTDNIEQAIERAGTKAGNKGFDCAVGAIEMVNLIREIEDLEDMMKTCFCMEKKLF